MSILQSIICFILIMVFVFGIIGSIFYFCERKPEGYMAEMDCKAHNEKLLRELEDLKGETTMSEIIKEIIYYSIVNTTSDRTRGETGRYKTYEEAKEDLKNHCDWYRENGTGTIYEVTEKLDITELGFEITRTRKQMLEK